MKIKTVKEALELKADNLHDELTDIDGYFSREWVALAKEIIEIFEFCESLNGGEFKYKRVPKEKEKAAKELATLMDALEKEAAKLDEAKEENLKGVCELCKLGFRSCYLKEGVCPDCIDEIETSRPRKPKKPYDKGYDAINGLWPGDKGYRVYDTIDPLTEKAIKETLKEI